MRRCILAIGSFLCFGTVFSQIVINQSDMPKEGDTLRVSITNTIPGDYSQTGPNMTWDFSGLYKTGQQINSFVNMSDVPLLYWITFIPGVVSNLASPGNNLPAFPGIPFSDFYTFYKKSPSLFSDAGFAFQLSGIPIMLKYDSADEYYQLPCTYGNTWTSHSSASFSIPGMVYFSSSKSRSSQVDGWGSLTTPFGTFQTIRVKSEVMEHDSIFLDSLGFGFPFTRNVTEYKWLGKGQGIPLLQISEEGVTATATYRDMVSHTGIKELSGGSFKIFPNPSTGFCTIYMAGKKIPSHLQILNVQGLIVLEQELHNSGIKAVSLDLSTLVAGAYMIRLMDKDAIYTGKVLIIPD
jgi:hypothetical protein